MRMLCCVRVKISTKKNHKQQPTAVQNLFTHFFPWLYRLRLISFHFSYTSFPLLLFLSLSFSPFSYAFFSIVEKRKPLDGSLGLFRCDVGNCLLSLSLQAWQFPCNSLLPSTNTNISRSCCCCSFLTLSLSLSPSSFFIH